MPLLILRHSVLPAGNCGENHNESKVSYLLVPTLAFHQHGEKSPLPKQRWSRILLSRQHGRPPHLPSYWKLFHREGGGRELIPLLDEYNPQHSKSSLWEAVWYMACSSGCQHWAPKCSWTKNPQSQQWFQVAQFRDLLISQVINSQPAWTISFYYQWGYKPFSLVSRSKTISSPKGYLLA